MGMHTMADALADRKSKPDVRPVLLNKGRPAGFVDVGLTRVKGARRGGTQLYLPLSRILVGVSTTSLSVTDSLR